MGLSLIGLRDEQGRFSKSLIFCFGVINELSDYGGECYVNDERLSCEFSTDQG